MQELVAFAHNSQVNMSFVWEEVNKKQQLMDTVWIRDYPSSKAISGNQCSQNEFLPFASVQKLASLNGYLSLKFLSSSICNMFHERTTVNFVDTYQLLPLHG